MSEQTTTKVRMRRWPLTIVLFAIWTLLVFGAGEFMGWQAKRSAVITRVEDTIKESIRTGRPFVFQGGRIGLVVREEHKGSLIAYRAIAFMWPEGE